MTPEEKKNKKEAATNSAQPSYTTSEKLYEEAVNYPSFDYNAAWNSYKNGGKPLVDALMSAYKKPEQPITPERAKKIKFASALTDSFATLAELFAHGQGAHIRNRQGNANQRLTNQRVEQLQDKYARDLERYNMLAANAEREGFNNYLRGYMNDNNMKRKSLFLRAEQVAKREQEAARQAARAAEYQRKREDKAADMATKFKHDLALIRARASYKNSGGRGTGDKGLNGIFLNAHERDMRAQTDALGRRVVPIELNKEQIRGYANTAKTDQQFLDANPQAFVDTFDPLTGKVIKGLTRDENLAWMYAQWLYDKQFAPTAAGAPHPPLPSYDSSGLKWGIRSPMPERANAQKATPVPTNSGKSNNGKSKFNHAPY